MSRQRIIIGALGIVAIFFMWEFVAKALLYDPYEGVQTERVEQDKQNGTSTGYKEAWGPEIRSRNLFSEGRSYSAPVRLPSRGEEVVVETPKAPKPEIKLSGIIKNQYGEYVAYMKIGKGSSVSVRKGDVIKDVTILDITERDVTIKWMDEEKTVLTLSNKPLVTR